MEKKIIEKEIFSSSKSSSIYSDGRYTWGELKRFTSEQGIELQDNDILEMGYQEEGWNHGDNSCDPLYFVKVIRKELESDKDFEKRKLIQYEAVERNKEERRRQYEKLKKEFGE